MHGREGLGKGLQDCVPSGPPSTPPTGGAQNGTGNGKLVAMAAREADLEGAPSGASSRCGVGEDFRDCFLDRG